jgi:hypothetical protein
MSAVDVRLYLYSDSDDDVLTSHHFLPPDFIGISAYAPLPEVLTPEAMEVPIQTLAHELAPFNISLRALLAGLDARGRGSALNPGCARAAPPGTPRALIYSEQGLGGTTDNAQLPPDLEYVRRNPFSGGPPAYSTALDPWKV